MKAILQLMACIALLMSSSIYADDKIHPWLRNEFSISDGSEFQFLVIMRDQASLVGLQENSTKKERTHFAHKRLVEAANRSQASIISFLDRHKIEYQRFYIVNALLVTGNSHLGRILASRQDVLRVEGNPRVKHPRLNAPGLPDTNIASNEGSDDLWNLNIIGAPDLWELGVQGQGIVVGGLDTGYRWTHLALRRNYRGWTPNSVSHDYNWHDAIHSRGGICGADSPIPCDDEGHGTATMAIVLGDDRVGNKVGVSPRSQWIGCRGMDRGYGTPATYLECLDFFLAPYPVNGAPTQGNPDLAPDLTTNSWVCPPSEGCSQETLQSAINNLKRAGIMVVAAAGNDGSACQSITDPPAIYDSAYTVASAGADGRLSGFSSRGQVRYSINNKPDIVGPGESIKVASISSDADYEAGFRGTSAAAPHVAGAVSLLWSALPGLRNNIDETENLINSTAVRMPQDNESCGGDYVRGPNGSWGFGRVDAISAYRHATNSWHQGCLREWRETRIQNSFSINQLIERQGVRVAVGSNGYHGIIVTSPDGEQWSQASLPYGTRVLRGVAWLSGRFVAVGVGGIYSSDDANTWKQVYYFNDPIYAIASNSGRIVAVGRNGYVFVSDNGESWKQKRIAYGNLFDIIWGGGKFVSVSLSGEVIVSPDGVNWEVSDLGRYSLRGVTWTTKRYIAVGEDGVILTSADARSWAPQNSNTSETLEAISSDGVRTVAVGNIVMSSGLLGVSWTKQKDSLHTLRGVSYLPNRFVAHGDEGYFIESYCSNLYFLQGKVLRNTDPLPGIKVVESHGSNDTTRANGIYKLFGLPLGEYIVHPVSDKYMFSPASRTIEISGNNVSGVDFNAFIRRHRLSVSKIGEGKVISNPAGISCGADCRQRYKHGVDVELISMPPAGSAFHKWRGDCTGQGRCSVSMNGERNITAIFRKLYTVTAEKHGKGGGIIISNPSGIRCGNDCREQFKSGSIVAFEAKPRPGSLFSNWDSGCSGISPICNSKISSSRTISAKFDYVGEKSWIRNIKSSKCMDPYYGIGLPDTPIIQYYCTDTSPSELWSILYAGDGVYQIKSAVHGMCLSPRDGNINDWTEIVLSTCSDSLNSKWKIESANSGAFFIRNARSNKCIDTFLGDTGAGANLIQYTCSNEASSMQWSMLSK